MSLHFSFIRSLNISRNKKKIARYLKYRCLINFNYTLNCHHNIHNPANYWIWLSPWICATASCKRNVPWLAMPWQTTSKLLTAIAPTLWSQPALGRFEMDHHLPLMTVYYFSRDKGISASGCLISHFTTQWESTPCVKWGNGVLVC